MSLCVFSCSLCIYMCSLNTLCHLLKQGDFSTKKLERYLLTAVKSAILLHVQFSGLPSIIINGITIPLHVRNVRACVYTMCTHV